MITKGKQLSPCPQMLPRELKLTLHFRKTDKIILYRKRRGAR